MKCQSILLFGALASVAGGAARAAHDIEFVAEHLPEVMMDNRYGTLPVWNLGAGTEDTAYQLQAAYSSSAAGDLTISGPLLSMSVTRPVSGATRLGAFGFYDPLRLRSNFDSRPLQTLFAPETPLARPVAAEFTGLDGTATDFGAGVFWSRRSWVAGVLWQRVDLKDYRFDYLITEGPQSGTQGQIDFDTHYDHFTPFFGMQVPLPRGDWLFTPHALVAYPVPRRGFQGHITGPGFDIAGDTASAGQGKHFGDPSVTLGFTVTYLPAHLSIDAGTFLSQAYLEQKIHKGIESNWLLSVSWTP